jgi:GNAT superfamily N-acetyltransferase
VAPTPAQLAEDTVSYLLPRPGYETVVRDEYVYSAGPLDAWVTSIRTVDLDWARTASRERGLPTVEWWVGWSAPDGTEEQLVAAGLVASEVPVLWGMTCAGEPPTAEVDVRRSASAAEYLEAVEVDWAVWEIPPAVREQRRLAEVARFDEGEASGVVHHWSAWLDGEPVGFARAIDLESGVALFGGAVLPKARKRGVYRALVHARWLHAAARGTPLLVVQAGEMSAPVLTGLGFETHGEIHLYTDVLGSPVLGSSPAA